MPFLPRARSWRLATDEQLSPFSRPGSPMAGTSSLATAEELTKLTRNPLETLCAKFGVDRALSGKPKGTLVQRLVVLKLVTVADVEAVAGAQAAARSPARAAAAPRPRKQSSMQAAIETKKRRLEDYIAREQGNPNPRPNPSPNSKP